MEISIRLTLAAAGSDAPERAYARFADLQTELPDVRLDHLADTEGLARYKVTVVALVLAHDAVAPPQSASTTKTRTAQS